MTRRSLREAVSLLMEKWSDAARAAAAAGRSRRAKGGTRAEAVRSARKAYSKAGGVRAGHTGGAAAIKDMHAGAAKHGLSVKKAVQAYKSMGGAFADFHSNPHGIAGMSFTHSHTQRGGRGVAPQLRYKTHDKAGHIISTGRSATHAIKKAIKNPKGRRSTFYPHEAHSGWQPPDVAR